MRYIIEDIDCNEIATFKTEKDRQEWLYNNCWFNGVNWLIYDMSSIPCKITSRVVFAYEE